MKSIHKMDETKEFNSDSTAWRFYSKDKHIELTIQFDDRVMHLTFEPGVAKDLKTWLNGIDF